MEQPFRLPVIHAIRFNAFDLYKKKPNEEVTIETPVFCLIGANGLGKSTFLNSLNFGVTGAIPDPARAFKSAAEYREEAMRPARANDYFSGRISEAMRPLATITVELRWPDTRLVVTRSLFGDGAAELEIRRADEIETLSSDTGDDVEKRYQSEVLRATGIPNFAQFVFLFHFVLTFDEGRHLIMWDDRAITTALYLAFGSDDAAAGEAERLNRAMERESSRARNVRFAAKAVKDRIHQLEEVVTGGSSTSSSNLELEAEYETLTNAVEAARRAVADKAAERAAADLRWTDLSAAVTEKQMEYRQLFAERASAASVVEFHPAIRATISQNCCAICHTDGVGPAIASKADHGDCPLCGTHVGRHAAPADALDLLTNLDNEILDLRRELENILLLRRRLEPEHQAATDSFGAAEAALNNFLTAEDKASALEQTQGAGWLRREIAKLAKDFDRLDKQAKAHRKKRDEFHADLRQVEVKLRKRYDRASEIFVPRFRLLAEQFIGLPIDVELEQRSGAETAGFRLKLTIDDQLRLSPERLSESQRFFVDIALRMALAEAITGGTSMLLIDTPEGSLDIAYEARAGQMFDTFARAGNHIVMTANLRSSELLINLAKLSGPDGMTVVKMTDWTELTDVQASEEDRLDRAYAEIEAALA